MPSMKLTILAILASLCVLRTTASPLAPESYTVTFEDPSAFGSKPPIPGVHAGLVWSGLHPAPFAYQAGLCAGICPHTFPNAIGFGQGFEASFMPATLSASYAGSTAMSFQLDDFYFGCQAKQRANRHFNPVAALAPANCTVTARGYAHAVGGEADATAVFEYVPDVKVNFKTGAMGAEMVRAVLPAGFEQVRRVVFAGAVEPGVYLSEVAVYLDSVSYRVTSFPEGVDPEEYRIPVREWVQ